MASERPSRDDRLRAEHSPDIIEVREAQRLLYRCIDRDAHAVAVHLGKGLYGGQAQPVVRFNQYLSLLCRQAGRVQDWNDAVAKFI